MGGDQERRGGGATAASPPAALARPAAGDAPPATMTARHDRESAAAEQALPPSVDDRLLRATIDVVATVGYAATEAADIVQAAGLSRTVFYRHCGGKRRATLAAARGVLDDLDRAVQAALARHDAVVAAAAARRGTRSRPGSPGATRYTPDGVGRPDPGNAALPSAAARATVGLTALAADLAADPPAAAVLILEAPAIGPDALALRTDLLTLIDTILSEPRGLAAWSPAGAVLDVFHRRVTAGDTTDLPALVPEILRALTALPS